VAGELAVHLVYNSKLSGPPDVTPLPLWHVYARQDALLAPA